MADLHYALKQFDWLAANAVNYDLIATGGDLLNLSSALDCDVQIVVVEKYLHRLRKKTWVLVSSGNHNLDGCNVAGRFAGVLCWTGMQFAGDGFLLVWIKRFSPDVVLSGHIHNALFLPKGSWTDRIRLPWCHASVLSRSAQC